MVQAPSVRPYANGDLLLETDGAVATLVLNRPSQRNAINLAMWRALPGLAADIAADASVRVVLVRGAGGHFGAGADIAEFPEIFASRAAAIGYTTAIEAATAALEGLDRPVIAWIEGYCIGAGLAVALACDLRICADTAQLGAPPARLGLLYSLSDTRRLIRAVGHGRARDMLLAATVIRAPEALAYGLATEVHPADQLTGAVAAKARALTDLSGWSQAHAKRIMALIAAGETLDTAEPRDWFAAAGETDHFQAALARFLGRRG